MNFIKQMERIKKIHHLIRTEKTGNPGIFKRKLQLSRRQLYSELETIKNLDVPIKCGNKEEVFYYDDPLYLELKYALNAIVENETQEIFSGFNFCAS